MPAQYPSNTGRQHLSAFPPPAEAYRQPPRELAQEEYNSVVRIARNDLACDEAQLTQARQLELRDWVAKRDLRGRREVGQVMVDELVELAQHAGRKTGGDQAAADLAAMSLLRVAQSMGDAFDHHMRQR